MIIKRLKLKNWRNYQAEEIRWDDSLNIIYGRNAQGKTNLLEAISYLGLASSFRDAADTDLIYREQEYFYLEADIYSLSDADFTISAALNRAKKRRWLVNGQPRQRLVDMVGLFHTVIFAPEDVYLVKGGPELRRRWLNRLISQLDPVYCRTLLTYNQVLRQRNAGLRLPPEVLDAAALVVWDKQLIEYGSEITIRRRQALTALSPLAAEQHARLSGGEKLSLRYQSAVAGREEFNSREELIELFSRELARHASAERLRGCTLVGPHRDEIKISVDGQPARDFASQGQQRTLAVSMKLAELETAFLERGEYPVLLLDDVLSELDEKRRSRLLELPEKTQTFISAADFDLAVLGRGRKWLVEASPDTGAHIR
jgi:DNA replication and repair protein RecF